MNASSRILIAALILAAGAAGAATPDHSGFSPGDCLDCHGGYDQPFMSPGPQDKSPYHQGFDCTQCHDTQDRLTPNLYYIPETIATPSSGDKTVVFTARSGANSFADGDATYDGICEVCHTTTGYHRNDATGDHTHEAGNTCVDCHTHGDGFATNCFSCHNAAVGTGGNRRQIVENAGDGNGDFVLSTHHVTDGSANEVVTSADCLVCHDNLNHMTYSDGVSVLLKDPGGGASILFDGTAASVEAFCLACHDGTHSSPFSDGNPAPDLTGWVGSNHGSPAASCFDCHQNGHGSGNFRLVDEQIDTPNSGAKTVVFNGRTGTNSFADGDATYDGVCEVCHTATSFHRNDATGDHGHYATQDCATCHDHGNSFEADGTDCISCHLEAVGSGGYRRQIVENAGDGGGDFVLTSHHVTNGTQTEVVTNADCVVCHDQANHMSYSDGVSVYLEDPSGGASVVYDGTPASLDAFCLACHDGTHPSPFSDGNAAADMSSWNGAVHGPSGKSCAECHPNGHGSPNIDLIGDTLATPNSGDWSVLFSGYTGTNSFADGDATYDGVCEACHTTTKFHRNDATGSHGHNAGNDCRSCHTHNTGYQADETACSGCHNTPQGAGGYRRQIVENANDGQGDFVLVSHHVTNGTTTEIVTDADCVVCHDQTNHMTYTDGVTVLLEDALGGASHLYDGTSASLESFCLACHDGTHSSPFSSANAAPDISTWDGNVHGPSGKSCGDCHSNGHGTGNFALIGDDLATPNSGTKTVNFSAWTGANSMADGDATYDGVCEVCHTTTNFHRNDATGDHAHEAANDCRSCHGHNAGYIVDTADCIGCHNSAQGSGGYRRQIVENTGDGNGDFVLASHHVTNGTTTEVVTNADCIVCHDNSNHTGYGDGVSVLLEDALGGASHLYDGTPASLDAFCQACHDGTHASPFSDGNAAPDKSGWNGGVHGPSGKSCAECHPNGHGTGNLNLVGDTISTPNSGDWGVVFSAYTGTNSFADGDATYNGVCEACHTTTDVHRNNASGGHEHNETLDCRSCHTHDAGYISETSCVACHNEAVGPGNYRRQVVENAGDGNGDFVLASHHVTNGTTTEIVTDADCVVCHDQSNHMNFSDGVSVLLVDPAGGSAITFNGTGSSIEAFCLACHDGTHTSPFSDGNPAPDKSAWDGNVHGPAGKTCWECHNNGHGSGNLGMFGDQIATPNSGTRTAILSAWTGTNSLADGDATYDGACEVCHTTTSFHRNDATGGHAHEAGNDCRSCHTHDAGYIADATDCMGCHDAAVGSGGYRRQIVENTGDGNGDFVLASHHVTNGTTTEVVTNADCIVCHDQANHMSYSDGVTVLLEDALGGASHVYDGTPDSLEPFCLSCHDGTHTSPFSDGNAAADMSTWDGSLHGPVGRTCAECHPNGHGTGNIMMIGDTIATPNSGDWTVLFSAFTGTNSFADGDATYNGVCEACHTTTNFHRNDPSGNHGHSAGEDCRGCHSHNTSYQVVANNCMNCHRRPQGTGDSRRQIVEDSGDGGGDFVLTSHHVTNGTTTEVVTNTDCVACHNQSNHLTYSDGVSVYLVDPAGGASITYDGTPESLEPFCLGCHDGTHTSPFSDGNPAPDKSAWDGNVHGPAGKTCAECHGNGHGSSNLALIESQMATPNSGTKSVILSSWTGANSFADGDATYDGVCEVCHTTTNFHRNDATGDHAHEAANDCRSCHTHDEGYAGDATDCLGCHNAAVGSGGNRRQIVENAGDGNGDFVLLTHHVTNGTQTEVVTNADCVVCHDQANHMSYSDGVSVYLVDPGGGASTVYDGTAASLENFCLACHDGTHSSPFSDGSAAPDKSGWLSGGHGAGRTCAECHNNGHGTSNLAMVSPVITTPSSGDKTVVLSSWTGTNSMADGNATYNGVCEVCHTVTDYHRNTSAGDHTHEAANDCRVCHDHDGSYAGAESAGGVACAGCHAAVVTAMNTSTTSYHHQVNSDAANYSTASKTCLMCHVDHDIFRSDLNTGIGTRAKNLRVDTSTAVVQGNSGVLLDSDYQSAGAGGVCLSCHVSAQTKSYAQPDGSTQTPALSKADYDAATTAHNYEATSTYNADSSTFRANCSKCHNDDMTKSYQSGNQFGTHDSSYRTMVDPAGVTGPSDPLEEDFCLKCHSTSGNPNSGSNLDYYGVKAMSSTSLRVGDAMGQTFTHPTSSVSGVHDVIETGSNLGDGNRHAECTDCHDVHATIASNPLKGVWGVTPTSWPARPTPTDNAVVFAAPSGYNVVTSGAEEWQICLKCHSNYVTLPGGSPNLAEEINPNYESMHGIAAAGTNPNCNSTTMNAPWGTTGRNACSDCHRSANSSDPGGPHGSNLDHLLVATVSSSSTAGTPLCFVCHRETEYWSAEPAASAFKDHPSAKPAHKVAQGCFGCHMWEFSAASGLGVNTTNNIASGRIYVHGMNKRWTYNEQNGSAGTGQFADAFNDGYLENMDYTGRLCWSSTCRTHSGKGYDPVKSLDEIPAAIVKARVYPLPSNGDVTILLEKEVVNKQGDKSMALVEVEASIYDISGRKIRDLKTSHQGAGDVMFQWDGRDSRGARVVSGLYFCRVKTAEFNQIVKIVIVR